MKYTFTGHLYTLKSRVWTNINYDDTHNPIPVGSEIIISDKDSGYSDILQVIPNPDNTCLGCWFYSHIEGQYCYKMLGCEDPMKRNLKSVKIICINDTLEGL